MLPALRICFLVISVLCLQSSVFGAPDVRSYDQLVHAIREVHHASEARIETAVEQEKVREAWETGKLIQEHILLNKDRADYGKQVMKRLSEDLEMSERELYFMREFYRTYPILPAPSKLTWSHYRELLSIDESKKRKEYASKAASKNWSQKELRREIRNDNEAWSSPNALAGDPVLEEVKPGKVGVYPVLEINGKHYYDLGFAIYSEIKGKLPKQQNPTESELHTYNAQVTEIYDGDTFYARIDLGFGTLTTQQLRLRRLDAPEIISSDGKEAKQVLEKILHRDKGRMVIKIEKSKDQYGRFLADIWVQGQPIEQELLDSELFQVREDV